MKHAIAEKFQVGKKLSYDIEGRARVHLTAASEEPFTLFGITPDGEAIPLKTGTEIKVNGSLLGFGEILLEGKKPIGATLRLRNLQSSEPMDDRPALRPDFSNNPLRKMREVARQQFGVLREAFADDTGLPNYEMPDEVGDIFEEEETAARRKAAKLAKAEKAAAEPSSPPDVVEKPDSNTPSKSRAVEKSESE